MGPAGAVISLEEAMHILLGRQPPTNVPLAWDPSTLINPHIVVAGDSGSGKTANLRHWCEQLAAQGAETGLERIHVFDPHGDIDVPASLVEFSQSTPYAYNPLDVYADKDYGGVRRAIGNFIGLLQRSSRQLGPVQQAVLRNLLLDVYMWRGFHPDDPSSWHIRPEERDARRPPNLPNDRTYLDVPHEEKEVAKRVARAQGATFWFDEVHRCWWTDDHSGGLLRWPEMSWGKRTPTVHDVLSLARLKLRQLFVGTDQKGLLALEGVCRAHAALVSKVKSTRRRSAEENEELLQAERDRAAERAVSATKAFIEKIATGTEIDDLIRYESADTLKGIIDRLENLVATGVCRTVPPPFDEDALIWRYGLRAYADDEKRLMVELRLERILQAAITRGPVDHVREICIIDEAPKFMVDDGDHILCRIINEARKFGIALVLIAQSPTQVPEQVLAGVGCKVILGLDPMYHQMGARRLALDLAYIQRIRPYELALVNLKRRGLVPEWLPLGLPRLGPAVGKPVRLAA
jgi:hypothetical protein